MHKTFLETLQQLYPSFSILCPWYTSVNSLLFHGFKTRNHETKPPKRNHRNETTKTKPPKRNNRNETTETSEMTETKPLKQAKRPKRSHEPVKDRIILHLGL